MAFALNIRLLILSTFFKIMNFIIADKDWNSTSTKSVG